MMENVTGMMHDVPGMVDQFTCLMDQNAGIVGNFMHRTHMYRIGTLEFAVVVTVLALSLSAGLLQLAVPFQLGQQEDADQRCSKAAIVQAHSTVPELHGGMCLYNGGFTAALVCLLMVPGLERHFMTKHERRHYIRTLLKK